MVSAARSNVSQRRPLPRKEKIIPRKQLGVEALPTSTETMEGVLEWLKTERLHKYWPVFSRMNYSTLIGLTEEKIDYALRCIGSQPITNGARGRILRCTERLRERSLNLESINDTTTLCEIADVFKDIALTPLSASDNEPNGVCLLKMFLQTFNQVVGLHGPNIVKNSKLRWALETYVERREVPKADKEYIEKLLKNLVVAAGFPASPSTPVKHTPGSSHTSSELSSSASPLRHQEYRPSMDRPSALRPSYRPAPLNSPPSAPIIRPAHSVEKASFQPSCPVITSRPPGLHSPFKQTEPPVDRTCRDGDTRKAETPTSKPLFSKPLPQDHKKSVRLLDQDKENAPNNSYIPEVATKCASIGKFDLNKLWGGRKNQVMMDLNVPRDFANP